MFAFMLVVLLAPAPVPSHAQQVLREQCLLLAADAQNPWAMAHAIKLFGAGFLASDGRRAAEVIMHDYLERAPTPDGATLHFRPFGPGPEALPIEPHINLNVKALVVEAHVPLTTTYATTFGKVTLRELVESARQGFRHVPSSADYWKDVAWTLDLLAATQKPGARWKTNDGLEISLDQVFDDALTELERATADLKAGMLKGDSQVDKRKQGLYAHSCGGLHFVQGVLAWAKNPAVRQRWGTRVDDQVRIHFYRFESERRQYEAAWQQAVATAPQFKLQVLVQMVKFYGHWLETAARFRDFGWKPSAEQQATIRVAKAMLDAAVRWLEAERAFERMDQLKTSQRQVYLDLIGDSCHAAHGLAAWP